MAGSIRGIKFGMDDRVAREQFLRTTPSGRSIGEFLSQSHEKAVSHRAFYEGETYTGIYVTTCDGRIV